MRKRAIAVGLFLLLSGLWAMWHPHSMLVQHQSTGSRGYSRRSGVVEFVSQEASVVYGVFAIIFGVFMLLGHRMFVLHQPSTDRVLAAVIVASAPSLLRRYGRFDACTRLQVLAAAEGVRAAPWTFPYLFAAFLGRPQLEHLEAAMPATNWKVVEATVTRIVEELPHDKLDGSHFHASWSGLTGN